MRADSCLSKFLNAAWNLLEVKKESLELSIQAACAGSEAAYRTTVFGELGIYLHTEHCGSGTVYHDVQDSAPFLTAMLSIAYSVTLDTKFRTICFVFL